MTNHKDTKTQRNTESSYDLRRTSGVQVTVTSEVTVTLYRA